MKRLSPADLRRLLELLQDVYAVTDRGGLPSHIVSTLPNIIGSDATSYDEIHLRGGLHTVVVDTLGTPFRAPRRPSNSTSRSIPSSGPTGGRAPRTL